MNINHITTMTRIGKVVRHATNEKKLTFEYDSNISRTQRKDNRGRVYAIVVDGEIKKLGGSQSKGGIDATFGFYFGGYSKGNSERTYCIWNFINRAVIAKKTVEIYCVWAPTVTVTIPTMTGSITQQIPVDFHSIEDAFVKEYVAIEGKFPFLNMQESGSKWENTDLIEGYINKDGSIYKKKVTKKVDSPLFV
jgi:hypothetical protein